MRRSSGRPDPSWPRRASRDAHRPLRMLVVVLLAGLMALPPMAGVGQSAGPSRATNDGTDVPTLFVGLEANSVVVLDDGTVLTGHDDGGIAEWDDEGVFLGLATYPEQLPSNHVGDLIAVEDVAIAHTNRGFLRRTGPCNWSVIERSGNQPSSLMRSCEDGAIGLNGSGSVLGSNDGISWNHITLPTPLGSQGWEVVDRSGPLIALTNGTGACIVNLTDESVTYVDVPGSPPYIVSDLAIGNGVLAVATDEAPNVYDIASGEWLSPALIDEVKALGTDWVNVYVDDRVIAVSRDGPVVEVGPLGSTPMTWTLLETISRTFFTDTVGIAENRDGRLYLATMNGTWVLDPLTGTSMLGDGTVSALPSSYVSGLEIAGDILWASSGAGLVGSPLDEDGTPTSWSLSPPEAFGQGSPLVDAAELSGVVYLAMDGDGIWTYDLYASSAPSRWNVTHYEERNYDMNEVHAVESIEGELYAGGNMGLERMERSAHGIEWVRVPRSPAHVTSLVTWNDMLYISGSGDVFEYDPVEDASTGPRRTTSAPNGTSGHLLAKGDRIYMAWYQYVDWSDSAGNTGDFRLRPSVDVQDLRCAPSGAGPIWFLCDYGCIAYDVESGDSTYFGKEFSYHPPEGTLLLPDVQFRDVVVGPDGTAYLASTWGIYRVAPYDLSWRQWTTAEGLSANDIRTVEPEPGADRLWVGAYGGVDVLDVATDGIEQISVEDGLPSNQVYDLLVQGGDVWAGTDVGGAGRRPLAGGEWTVYNMTTGLVAEDVQAVALTGTKAVFGTDSGVSVLDLVSSSISTHTRSSTSGELPSDWVWCLLAAGDRVWAGTASGLSWYDPRRDRWTEALSEQLEGRAVRSLLADALGRLWVGTEEGLLVMNLTSGTAVEPPDASRNAVLALMQDSEGLVWAGTAAGALLMDLEGRVRTTFTSRDGLVHDRVTSLAELPEGRIWFGTAGGLSSLERTPWGILPQYSVPSEKRPDVRVDTASVTIEPQHPFEGDVLTVRVRVDNPTELRAIATVVLSSEPVYSEGAELASAIAYTEPGGNYTVDLCWTAPGGEHVLWVMVDPTDLIPESDERNNQVTIGVIVDRRPTLRDLSVTLDTVRGGPDDTEGVFDVEVVYTDADGDAPVDVLASAAGSGVTSPMSPVAGSGRLADGLLYRGSLALGRGTHEVAVVATYASGLNVTLSTAVGLNFNISVVGVAPGAKVHGINSLALAVLEPWEGSSVGTISVTLVGTVLNATIEVPTTRDGLNLTFEADALPTGTYDLVVLAHDDRGLPARYVIEDVSIVEPPEDGMSYYPIALALVGIVALLLIAFVLRRRSRGGVG